MGNVALQGEYKILKFSFPFTQLNLPLQTLRSQFFPPPIFPFNWLLASIKYSVPLGAYSVLIILFHEVNLQSNILYIWGTPYSVVWLLLWLFRVTNFAFRYSNNYNYKKHSCSQFYFMYTLLFMHCFPRSINLSHKRSVSEIRAQGGTGLSYEALWLLICDRSRRTFAEFRTKYIC